METSNKPTRSQIRFAKKTITSEVNKAVNLINDKFKKTAASQWKGFVPLLEAKRIIENAKAKNKDNPFAVEYNKQLDNFKNAVVKFSADTGSELIPVEQLLEGTKSIKETFEKIVNETLK